MKVTWSDPLYRRAYTIARSAHAHTVDAGGNPYIEHCKTVASKMEDVDLACAAMLHDVIEDTLVSDIDLIKLGIPQNVVDLVIVLTRKKGEVYRDYIKIKLADLEDNMNLDRIKMLDDRDIKRVEKRYKPAYEYLEAVLNEGEGSEDRPPHDY